MLTTLLVIYFTLGYSLICSSSEVHMAFGEKLPPYIFPESNSGIEIEIVQEALLHNGHILKPEYFTMGRIPVFFKNKQVDAIMMDVGVNFEKKAFTVKLPLFTKMFYSH